MTSARAWHVSKSKDWLALFVTYYLLISKEHTLKTVQQLAATLQAERELLRGLKNADRCPLGRVKISASFRKLFKYSIQRYLPFPHCVFSLCGVLFPMASTKQF